MIFDNTDYQPHDDESVLECLLRHGVEIDYSCKSGNCQSCILKSLQGDIDTNSQRGLKPTAIEQGFFFACQQKASTIDHASFIDDKLLFSHARLVDKYLFCDDICRITLEPVNSLYYHAGQFINLKNPMGVVRSYSIASLPSDNQFVELHIHKKHNGAMTDWIFKQFNIGDNVDFQGPIGECFYTSSDPNCPIILIGTGTGAAPLIGILKDALKSNHKGSIVFYHGAKTIEGLYLHDELLEIEKNNTNFDYRPCLSPKNDAETTPKITLGYCNEIALNEITPSGDTLLFLCGNPDMVNQTRKKAFLAGIASKNIYVDPFEYKDLRKASR